MTVVKNKWVARAVDGYGRTMHKTLLYRAGAQPSIRFAREILGLFVRRSFTVTIEPATVKDLS
jgi:hypothetical protein